MIRESKKFELTQISDPNQVRSLPSILSQFGKFIYKDHITHKQYNLQNLKPNKNTPLKQLQINSSLFVQKDKYHKKSGQNFKIQSKLCPQFKDEFQNRKRELEIFLKQLQMIKKIRKNRNYIVSGTQKAEKRQSILPQLSSSMLSQKQLGIDLLKQQIRREVDQLSTELFRQYLTQQQPYRMVFNELTALSSKGALNTNKIKQIKQKIKECAHLIQKKAKNASLVGKTKLDSKQNQIYDQFFDKLATQISQEIHFKIKHEASYNWKYGNKNSSSKPLNNSPFQFTLTNLMANISQT